MEISQKDIETLINSTPGDFCIYKYKSGRLETLYFSRNIPSHAGLTETEYRDLIGNDAINIVLPEDRDYLLRNIQKTLFQSGKISISYRIYHKASKFIWLTADARLLGEQDHVPVLISMFRTAQNQAMEFSSLLNFSEIPIYVIEKDNWELLYMNDYAEKFFNISQKSPGLSCYATLFKENAPCRMCPALKLNGESSREEKIKFPNGRYYSVKIQNVSWFGREAWAISAVDVSEKQNLQKEMDNFRILLETVANANHFLTWKLNILTRELLPDNTSREFFEKNFQGNALSDIPTSILYYVAPQSRDDFLSLYRDVFSRKKISMREIWYNENIIHETHCVRLIYYVPDGNQETSPWAYGFAADITGERVRIEQYKRFRDELVLRHPNDLSVNLLDLTDNKFEECLGTDPVGSKNGTADSFFDAIAAQAGDSQALRTMFRTLNRTVLMDQFENGKTYTEFEFRRNVQGKLHWAKFIISMMRDPISNHLEANTTLRDIDVTKKDEMIIENIYNKFCTYVGIIDVKTQTLKTYGFRKGVFDSIQDETPWEDAVQIKMEKRILPEDREIFRSLSKIGNVISHLAEEETYTVTFRQQNKDQTFSYYQVFYTYLNAEKDSILMGETNISSALNPNSHAWKQKSEKDLPDSAENQAG